MFFERYSLIFPGSTCPEHEVMALESNSEDIRSVTGAVICKGLLLRWNPRAEKTLDQNHITLCTIIERCAVTLCNNDMIRHTRCCIRNTSQQNWHPSRLARRLHQEMTGYHQQPGHCHHCHLPSELPRPYTFYSAPNFHNTITDAPQLSIAHSVNGVHSGNVHRVSTEVVLP